MGGMLLQKFSRLSFMFYLKNHYTGLFFCCEPMGRIMLTREKPCTHMPGTGFCWVWVQVWSKLPMGYPCSSLMFLEKALSTSHIHPSKSPISVLVFFVKKKDGKLQFIQDYRALNVITHKNRYPLPLIDNLIHCLKGARYFTKLDVHWGYNHICIKEGDKWKAAFCMNHSLFEPLMMYFVLTNSPTTFQMMMNKIFHDLILQGVVIIYLDNILIFTDTLEEHNCTSQIVMECLCEHKLYLQHDKCNFEKTHIVYLSIIISQNHVEMDPVKIAGVMEWPVPMSKKEVQSFMGFTNFYCWFISNFSHHAHELFDLTKKDIKFMWSNCEQDMFDTPWLMLRVLHGSI